jgi:hypothetical protein
MEYRGGVEKYLEAHLLSHPKEDRMKWRRGIVQWLLVMVAMGVLAIPVDASRQPLELVPDATKAACGCRPGSEWLRTTLEEIAAAENVQEARAEAIATTRTARIALGRARWLAPWSDDLRDAVSRLENYEERVEAAEDPQAVADELAGLVQLASAGRIDAYLAGEAVPAEADLDDNGGGCDYSTGEVIAIVVGFILGIIPGIILLFVLC